VVIETILFIIGVPLAVIAFTAKVAGFRTFYILAASVVGELLGLLLLAAYTRISANAILSGKKTGAVLYFPPAALRDRLETSAVLFCLAIAIGGIVLLGRSIYVHARSA
jgi:hypothetical protein